MKINRVVVNASPLIILFKSRLAHLLPDLFEEILIPIAVWDEVTAGKNADIAARELPSASWAKRVEIEVAPVILVWNLGQGESEVLSAALENPGYHAMVDDAAARRCARAGYSYSRDGRRSRVGKAARLNPFSRAIPPGIAGNGIMADR